MTTDENPTTTAPGDWSTSLRARLTHLVSDDGPRAARSDLRSGLRHSPSEAVRLHRYVATFVAPDKVGSGYERAVYAVAALAGAYPSLTTCADGRSLGTALGGLASSGDDNDMAWRRLAQLVRLDQVRLVDRLPSVVALLTSRGEYLDLSTLAKDLASWDRNRDRVAQRWVRDFTFRAIGTADNPGTVTTPNDQPAK